MGDAYVHRLVASDAILAGFTVAEDAQDGCVRFSAVEAGSRVPRRYLSVATGPQASLFTSTAFGDPGYGQLLETADRAIVSGATAVTITAGAETGSEMGAFSSLLAPIKERGLLFKYGEYMPLGLTPVIVHVT
jgi:acetyl-CoA acetyltransferase